MVKKGNKNGASAKAPDGTNVAFATLACTEYIGSQNLNNTLFFGIFTLNWFKVNNFNCTNFLIIHG